MAQSITILSRSYLPGVGITSTGANVQTKTRVVALVTVSSYTAGGEPLAPLDLGLGTFDHVAVTAVTANDAATGISATVGLVAEFDYPDQLVTVATQTRADGIETVNVTGEAAVYRVVAEGDSAAAPDLL